MRDAAAQAVQPRIAGLENNAAYMELLVEDARLQAKEDSLVNAVGAMRESFRHNRDSAAVDPDAILALESSIFDVRNRRGQVTAKINVIEQEWVLENMDSAGEAGQPAVSAVHGHSVPEASKVRNLIYNLPFARILPEGDYAELKRSQRMERLAGRIADRYRVLYDSLVETAASYAAAESEERGIPLFEKYGVTERMARTLSDSLASVWGGVFDCKSYSYGYLLEQLDREDLLDSGERAFSACRSAAASAGGAYASDALTDYCLQRAAMISYEADIADALELHSAADSLRAVLRDESAFDFRLPAVAVEERLFLDYAPVEFASPAIYSARNPIPECRVFERGTIYRVLLGTFWSKQAVSIFRGACPLSFLRLNGKHLYFAGGYRTRTEAENAAAELRRHGFRNPVVAVWRDGVYRNLATDPEPESDVAYRIEISGARTLPEAVRTAMAEKGGGCELTRVGDGEFVAGAFDSRSEAEALAGDLRAAAGDLKIIVVEIGRE